MRALTEFLRGIGLYWQGFRTWKTDPGLMAIGLVPGLITGWIFVVAFVALTWWLEPLSTWIAGLFVSEGTSHSVIAFAAGLGIVGATVLVAVYGFVSVTSVVGQPFFEHLSHAVDDGLGAVTPGPEWPWWRNAVRGIGEGLRISLVTVPVSVLVVLCGLVPVIGTAVGWVVGALVGGWFVALEFSAIPFERRGLLLRDRRRILGAHRARTLGFGAMAFVMAVVAPVAVVMMPSAVAGGTLLARWALDQEAAEGPSAAD